jgi:hypothetical protein
MTVRMSAALLAVLLLFARAETGFSQTNTGEIGGVIKDPTGAVLPSATVAVRNPATGIGATRISDDQGRFFFPALQNGQWEVTISLPAFATQTRRVTLEIGTTLNLELTLTLEGVAQQVDIVVADPLHWQRRRRRSHQLDSSLRPG